MLIALLAVLGSTERSTVFARVGIAGTGAGSATILAWTKAPPLLRNELLPADGRNEQRAALGPALPTARRRERRVEDATTA
jgi:hypothetical protein